MALKTVKRVTISLPKSTISKLEAHVPKNKRSRFIAEAIEKEISHNTKRVTLKEISDFWDELADKYPLKEPLNKTSEELVREDRSSH